ncbi:hypothetical protein Pmar_PMAR013949, partial [Perkinsus marinus ATCC 50983]
ACQQGKTFAGDRQQWHSSIHKRNTQVPFAKGSKYEPDWEKVHVIRRIALNMYEVTAKDKNGQLYARVEHTKNLKRLTPTSQPSAKAASDNPVKSSDEQLPDICVQNNGKQEVVSAQDSNNTDDVLKPLNGFELRRSARLRALQNKKGGM